MISSRGAGLSFYPVRNRTFVRILGVAILPKGD